MVEASIIIKDKIADFKVLLGDHSSIFVTPRKIIVAHWYQLRFNKKKRKTVGHGFNVNGLINIVPFHLVKQSVLQI